MVRIVEERRLNSTSSGVAAQSERGGEDGVLAGQIREAREQLARFRAEHDPNDAEHLKLLGASPKLKSSRGCSCLHDVVTMDHMLIDVLEAVGSSASLMH